MTEHIAEDLKTAYEKTYQNRYNIGTWSDSFVAQLIERTSRAEARMKELEVLKDFDGAQARELALLRAENGRIEATVERLEVTLRRVTQEALDLCGEDSEYEILSKLDFELKVTDGMLAARAQKGESE